MLASIKRRSGAARAAWMIYPHVERRQGFWDWDLGYGKRVVRALMRYLAVYRTISSTLRKMIETQHRIDPYQWVERQHANILF